MLHRLSLSILGIWLGLTLPAPAQDPPPTALPADTRPLPIDLPTALRLADANPIDVAVAVERLRAASASLERAEVLWLPNLSVGIDYFRHDGQLQDIAGRVFGTSRSSLMVGAGPNAVFALADALYAPLAARQVVRARQFDVQTARNDAGLAVAEAYFNVQQARGDVAGTLIAVRHAEELVRRTEQLAAGLVPAVEVSRARTELARRRQGVESAYERWQTASADLVRLLRLDATTTVAPAEPPHLVVEIVDATRPVDELVPVALTKRPELASQQALVQATLARLKQERIRPLVPSVLLRGAATNPATLSGGYFGGGFNDDLSNFGARHSYDVQVIWELRNLGFGDRAAVRERAAENRQALLELFRTQDRIAAEVVQAHAQARRATARRREAEEGVRHAGETVEKSLQGLGQTRRAAELLVLVFRPQEVVAAIAALDQAYRDWFSAVADANRAEFRLYRALGNPPQCALPPLQGPAKAAEALDRPPVDVQSAPPDRHRFAEDRERP